jgi:hypothetical protein
MIEIIIIGAVLSIIVFWIQAILCIKVNKKAVKLIPAYIIVVIYAICIFLCFFDQINGNGGVAIWKIFAFIISIANTVALLSDILAWIVSGKLKI